MATVYKKYLSLKDGKDISFEPASPEGDRLGGVSAEQVENWNNAAFNKVEDVLINGDSILDADKVANIPIANSTTSGVLKVHNNWTGYGILVNPEGFPYIAGATDAQINARSSAYNPITAKSAPIAVKSAITSVTDDAWSDAEKAAACARIGAEPKSGDWEYIGEFDWDASVVLSITQDSKGNPFRFKSILINAACKAMSSATNVDVRIYPDASNWVNHQSRFTVSNGIGTGERHWSILANILDVGERLLRVEVTNSRNGDRYANSNNNQSYSYPVIPPYQPLNEGEYIGGIMISAISNGATGNKLKIYGVRA